MQSLFRECRPRRGTRVSVRHCGHSKGLRTAAEWPEGWIYKNLRLREGPTIYKRLRDTLAYELGHAGLRPRRHAITWFGELSYNKIPADELPEPEVPDCPSCKGQLFLIDFPLESRYSKKLKRDCDSREGYFWDDRSFMQRSDGGNLIGGVEWAVRDWPEEDPKDRVEHGLDRAPRCVNCGSEYDPDLPRRNPGYCLYCQGAPDVERELEDKLRRWNLIK